MDLKIIGDQLKKAAADEAAAFIAGHADAVMKLGENAVKAILTAEVHQALPIPSLPEHATAIQLADYQEVLTARRNMFQLVAAAEKQDAATVRSLKLDASRAAGRLASVALGTVLSVGLKAVLGI